MAPAYAIRPARAPEAAALTALCVRSKAHWGYDAGFMARAAPALEVEAEAIAAGLVLVAEDDAGAFLGVAAVSPTDDCACSDLAQLFVAPEAMRRGIGRALFAAACALARSRGADRMTILADPSAAPFYAQLGARPLGEAPSDAIPGRRLPLFDIGLRGTD